jgi:hypothetical protein
MGLKEFNAIRHSEPPEEVEDLPVPATAEPSWDRGDVVLGSWMDRVTYEQNLRRLEERGLAPRHPDDESFLRRLYGSLMD